MNERRFFKWALAATPPSLAGVVILWGMAVIARAEWASVWPFPFDHLIARRAMLLLAVAWSAVTVWIVYQAWRSLPDRRTRRIWLWLLAYPSWVFLTLWVLLPAVGPSALPWLAPVLVALLVPALRQAGGRSLSGPDGWWPGFRRFLWVDILVIAVPCVLALGLADAPEWSSARVVLSRSLLTYPLYAYVQLLLFLSLPALLLQRLGVPDRMVVVSVAALFALLHWPNTLLVAATGMAMLIWCSQWLRGRRLWALALVMGLAGAAATALLPARLTGEMRIGPRYIDKRIELACVSAPETCHAQEGRRP